MSKSTLREVYYGIFSSLLSYCNIIWGQIQNKNVNRIIRLQNKALRVINFAHNRQSSSILYKNSKILKFSDCIQLQNLLIVHERLKGTLPSVLHNIFGYIKDKHNYNTRSAKQNLLTQPKVNTQVYGIMSITYQAMLTWNKWARRFAEKEFLTQTNKKQSKGSFQITC